jgi:sugar phosphate isomerase/epimerase
MNFPIIPLAKEIEELSRIGFDYIEIALDPPEASPEKAQQIKKQITTVSRQQGLGMIAHLPTFVSIADLTEKVRRASVAETVAALETASKLGMEKVVLHPPAITGLGRFVPKRVRAYGLSSLREILDRANGLGMKVCLENMFIRAGGFMTPREFEPLFEEFPKLGLTLDVGHAYLAGGIGNVLEFIRILGSRIHHLHVNDNSGREDNHLPVGAGSIDFRRVIKALRSSGYDETMTLEVFSPDRDYLKISREKMKALWEEIS